MNFCHALSLVRFLRSQQGLSLSKLFSSSAVQEVTSDLSQLPDQSRDVQTLEDFPTYFSPTFNFAAYVNKSETLKKFVELGVDLSKIEKKKGLPQYVLQLDFDRDVKKHLFFLHDLGLPADYYGYFLTKNPLIFKESIEDLETRVYYLRSKKFSLEKVRDIVGKNPFWLSFSTRRIDRRLGWFQNNFKLTGDDIRFLVHKQPKLITYNMEHIRESTFSIKEEMGFDADELKVLLLSKPKLWMNSTSTAVKVFVHLFIFHSIDHEELIERFDYVHNVMKISHDEILRSPEILTSRRHRLKQRYEFLKFLGKVEFSERKAGYISLKSLVEGTDKDFVLNVCKSSLETYDNFLKTL